VAELVPRLELRENIALLGDDTRAAVSSTHLTRWAARESSPPGRRVTVAALAATVLTTAGLAGWLSGLPATVVLAPLLAHAALAWRQRRWVDGVAEAVGRPAHELAVLSRLIARIEREPVQAVRLQGIRAALTGADEPASRSIANLERLAERLDWRRNMLFRPLDFLLFWSFHAARGIERWRGRCGPRLGEWLRAAGEMEALLALASHAFEHPGDRFPELLEGEPRFDAAGLAHPLLPAERAVRNELSLGGELRVLVVSGSNMSGTSTLLRAIGVNTVLALAGATVRAERLRLTPLEVTASIRIADSLLAGRSRFYAELHRLKQVVDVADRGGALLFLLDEVLHGTNSHDRRIGAELLVRHLAERGALGLLTTHDLALSRLADTLAPAVANVHFEDRLEEGEILFDYRLRPGTVTRSNALALMRAVGLPVPGS
jgi:hypothetical protein